MAKAKVAPEPEATTKAASKKAAATTSKAAASKEKKPKPVGDPTRQGKTTGLNVTSFWAHLFTQNALKAAKRGVKPLTDLQITDAMYAEFPERHSEIFKAVSTVRSRFNAGVLSSKIEAPEEPSVAYDDLGKPLAPTVKMVPKTAGGMTAKAKSKLPPETQKLVQPVAQPKTRATASKGAAAKAAAMKSKA